MDSDSSITGQEYQVAFILYSSDGKRAAEVRAFCNGETYLSEEEWVEGTTFENRHSGRMVGPFASPEEAEKFIVKTTWFNGRPMTSRLDPPQRSGWHLSGWPAALLATIVFPIALLISMLPIKRTRDRSAADVACFLKEFIDGARGQWDWDDFESIPIKNPLLDRIREEAAAAGPPNADLPRLRELLARAEALAGVVRNS